MCNVTGQEEHAVVTQRLQQAEKEVYTGNDNNVVNLQQQQQNMNENLTNSSRAGKIQTIFDWMSK